MIGLVGEASAARLLPGQLFIEDNGLDAGRGQLSGGECACRTSTQYRDLLHLGGTEGWPGGIAPPGASAPPGGVVCGFSPEGMAPPCGLPPPARGFTTQRLPLRSSVYG